MKPPYGVIAAIDLNTGTLKFQVPHGENAPHEVPRLEPIANEIPRSFLGTRFRVATLDIGTFELRLCLLEYLGRFTDRRRNEVFDVLPHLV